jgi:hypothetical protein
MTAQAPLATWFTVDPWDPGYGLAFSDEGGGSDGSGALEESSAELDLELELPARGWRPIDPDPSVPVPATLLFLDGSGCTAQIRNRHPGSPHRSR